MNIGMQYKYNFYVKVSLTLKLILFYIVSCIELFYMRIYEVLFI